MATVKLTADLTRGATAVPDNRPWYVWAASYQGDDHGVITPVRSNPIRPVAGVLTIPVEPGIVAYIENPDGKRYYVTAPLVDTPLWTVIEASIAVPPDTSADMLAAAIDNYIIDNPLNETVAEQLPPAVAAALDDADIPGQVVTAIAADGTVVDAAAAAVTADIAGRDLVEATTEADDDGIHLGIRDSSGRVQTAWNDDGTTDIALPNLAGMAVRAEPSPLGYIRGTKDADGRVAEDALDKNGCRPYWVIERGMARYGTTADGKLQITSRDQSQIDSPGQGLTQRQVVLTKGVSGFDSYYIESPCVFLDPKTGLLVMLYVGYQGTSSADIVASHGYATSPDGLTWTKVGQLFTGTGVDGDPDESGVTGPVMIVEDGVYHLFYIGLTEIGYEGGLKTICHATATSLAGPWTRHGVQIARHGLGWRRDAVWHPNLVYNKRKWWMFFNATGQVGGPSVERCGVASADSLDGPWTVDDANSPILPDAGHVNNGIWGGDPFVCREGGVWRMVFSRTDDAWGDTGDYDAYTTDEDFPLGWVVRGRVTDTAVALSGFKPWIIRYNGATFHYGTGSSQGIVVARTPDATAGSGGKLGFRGATPIVKPTVTGSRGSNAALTSLLTALASYGLITDSTS